MSATACASSAWRVATDVGGTRCTENADRASANAHGVTFREAFGVWARVAALSFGGPAGQIAVMHRILVEEQRWVSEPRFLHALNYCMLLPGPEAQQLAIYIGWLLHRTPGGLVAGILFVLPGFLSILLLSVLYAVYQDAAFVEALFFGLKAAVLAVVVEAVFRIGRRALRNRVMLLVAALAFVGIFFLEVPFPLIVGSAIVIGFLGGRLRPDLFVVIAAPDPASGAALADSSGPGPRPSRARAFRVLVIWLAIWLVPVGLVVWALGPDHVLSREGLFFSKVATVTFGGAYAVLAYVAQQAVDTYHWLQPGEMLDGLGLAETTPGPLIQVVQFVGFMGAFRSPEPFSPLIAGVLGSIIVTWATFAPCFLWIFLGAPYIERLRGNRLLSAALSTVTAAVVGVILNLAVWFALHVLFARVRTEHLAGVRLLVPDPATLDVASLLIAAGAFVALLRLNWGMMRTLGVAAATGLVYELFLRG
ncbi:MAG: chromate efflux transporter [Gammaproteobacteria bacterium]